VTARHDALTLSPNVVHTTNIKSGIDSWLHMHGENPPQSQTVGRSTASGVSSDGVSDTFDPSQTCRAITIVAPHGRSAIKSGQSAHGSFALFSRVYSSGVSEWKVRIDAQTGVIFLGVLEENFHPPDGLARKLITPAWMLSNYGYVCKTGGPRGQVALTEASKEEVGDTSTGALIFEAGDTVSLRLDRDARTLSVQVCVMCVICVCEKVAS